MLYLYDYIWLITVFIICIIVLLFFGIYAICVSVSNMKRNTRHQDLNRMVEAQLTKSGFNVGAIYALCDSASTFSEDDCRMWVFVDKVNSKIAFIDYELGKVSIVNFKDVINYEIYKNGGMVANGAAASVMPMAGLFGATTHQLCKDLTISIRINDVNNPHVAYDFIGMTMLNLGLNTESKHFKEIITSLQKFVSFLEMVINSNKQTSQQKIENPTNQA